MVYNNYRYIPCYMNVYIACYIPWYIHHDIYFWSNKSTYSARKQNTWQVIYHVIYVMIYIMVYTMIFAHAIYHAIYHDTFHTSIASSTVSPGTSTSFGIGRSRIIAAIASASRTGNPSKRLARLSARESLPSQFAPPAARES